MPHLTRLPGATEPLVFQGGTERLPRTPFHFNLLRRVFELPGMGRGRLMRTLIRRHLGLPASVNMNPGFFCSTGRLHCGECVDLADTFFLDYAPVYIGECTWFSYRNVVITAERDYDCVHARPVVIGRNVWITTNVTILPGVRIGDNSIIGAGSVVVADVPANVMAAGNPCRPIREIDRRCRVRRNGRPSCVSDR